MEESKGGTQMDQNRELTIYYEPGVIDTQLSAWKDVSIRYSEK